MYWEVISNERSSLQEYRLIDGSNCKLVLKYNPRHQSARITSGPHHRLIFFESAGSLSGKTIFRNQYGMEIGYLLHDKFQSGEGSLVIDNKKYQYQLQNDPSPELIIYNTDINKPITSCRIPLNKSNNKHFASNTQTIDHNCYLLGLCWYLFLPLEKENTFKFASAGF